MAKPGCAVAMISLIGSIIDIGIIKSSFEQEILDMMQNNADQNVSAIAFFSHNEVPSDEEMSIISSIESILNETFTWWFISSSRVARIHKLGTHHAADFIPKNQEPLWTERIRKLSFKSRN